MWKSLLAANARSRYLQQKHVADICSKYLLQVLQQMSAVIVGNARESRGGAIYEH